MLINIVRTDGWHGIIPGYECTACGARVSEDRLRSSRPIQYRYDPETNQTTFSCRCGNRDVKEGSPKALVEAVVEENLGLSAEG